MRRADVSILAVGERHERPHLALHFVVSRIARDADNFRVELPAAASLYTLADGIAAEIELRDERLVDDSNLRRVERVGTRDLATGEQRDTQRAQVISAHVGVHCL